MMGLPDGMARLLRPEAMQELVDRADAEPASLIPSYVRYKPGTGAVVAYHDTNNRFAGYVRWTTCADRARTTYAKAMTMRPTESAFGPSVTLLADGQTVWFGFPNDAKLRKLAWLTSTRKLKRTLEPILGNDQRIRARKSSLRLVRYKPERRLVARAGIVIARQDVDEHREMYVRYTADRSAAFVHRVQSHLRHQGLHVPEPVALLMDGALHVELEIPGTPVLAAVDAAGVDPGAVADTVRMLHLTPPPPGLGIVEVAETVDRAKAALDQIVTYDPGLVGAAVEVRRRIVHSAPLSGTVCLIHGDLHFNQFVLGSTGVALVDLERAALGDPLADIGRLSAHAFAMRVRRPDESPASIGAFTREIVDLLGKAGSESRLGFWIAAALVDQALLVCRHLEDDWQTNAERLLIAARRLSRDPWKTFEAVA